MSNYHDLVDIFEGFLEDYPVDELFEELFPETPVANVFADMFYSGMIPEDILEKFLGE